MDSARAGAGPVGLPPGPGVPVQGPCAIEVGYELPSDLGQLNQPSGAHTYPPPKMDVQPRGTLVPCPVAQGDQTIRPWIRAPSLSSGLSSFLTTPESRKEGPGRRASSLKPEERARPLTPLLCLSVLQEVLAHHRRSLRRRAVRPERPSRRTHFSSCNGMMEAPASRLFCCNSSTSQSTCSGVRMTASIICALAIDRDAGQVLWELPPHATTADLERLLQTRFGTQLQAESFRAKLHTRHRADGETLQDLYRDISRLIQLAHPGVGDKLVKYVYVGVESFVAALNYRDLECEVLKLEPADLEEAVSHAVRLEALMHSVNAGTAVSIERAGRRTQSHPHNVFAVSNDKQDKDSNADLLQRLAQLEKQLKQATKGSRGSSSKKTSSKETGGRSFAGQGESASAEEDTSHANPDTQATSVRS